MAGSATPPYISAPSLARCARRALFGDGERLALHGEYLPLNLGQTTSNLLTTGMRHFLAIAVWLILAGGTGQAAPSGPDGWGPLPPTVKHEVDGYFTSMELALRHNRLEMVMALYTPDATEELPAALGGRYGLPAIRARRQAEMLNYVNTSTLPPTIQRNALTYQPGATVDSFRIKYQVQGQGVPSVMPSTMGDIVYSFQRGEAGIQLSSTVVHPVMAPPAPRKVVKAGDPLPTEITLTNGVKLHQVKVVNWQPDVLTLQHVGGTDPIRLAYIVPEDRAYFTANMERALEMQRNLHQARVQLSQAEQQLQSYQQQRQAAEDERRTGRSAEIEEEIAHHRLMVGMTMDQVRRSWGSPSRINTINDVTGTGTLWIYDGRGVDANGNAANAGVGFSGDHVMGLYNVKLR